MSPWKAAIPMLIIGPITYLVIVAILFCRKHYARRAVAATCQT